MVIPVPVNAEMLSKTPSTIGMFVDNVKTIPPIILAHNHAKDEIIIPCLSRIFLGVEFSKYFLKATPKAIEIAAGITKLMTSNSKYIKSNINGTRHIIPIPIIRYPESLATINKSLLVIYLIIVLL